LANSLAWGEEALKPDVTSSQAAEWLLKGDVIPPQDHSTADLTASNIYPVWRSVELNQRELSHLTDEDDLPLSQTPRPNNNPAHDALAITSSADFIEHSLALIDNLDSSQLIPTTNHPPGAQIFDPDTSLLSTTSFLTTSSDISFQATSDSLLPTSSPRAAGQAAATIPTYIPTYIPITDLKRVPTPQHITSLHPQTITINLIAGIIAVSPTRTVSLRRRSGEMEIIEVTVGDDTRAGFSISFWLTPLESQQRAKTDDLRTSLKALRSGDVVLMRNVALSSFRGCVYGQSLARRRFARSATEVDVLGADVGEGAQASLQGVFGPKVRRVREWSEQFVGAGRMAAKGAVGRGVKRAREELPPDTPE